MPGTHKKKKSTATRTRLKAKRLKVEGMKRQRSVNKSLRKGERLLRKKKK